MVEQYYILNTDEQVFITSHIYSIISNQTLYRARTLNVTYYFDNNLAGSGLGNSIFMTSINSCKQYCSQHHAKINSLTLAVFLYENVVLSLQIRHEYNHSDYKNAVF